MITGAVSCKITRAGSCKAVTRNLFGGLGCFFPSLPSLSFFSSPSSLFPLFPPPQSGPLFTAEGFGNERTNEVYLPMNGVNNDWLPVEAEAHQSWPPKKIKRN